MYGKTIVIIDSKHYERDEVVFFIFFLGKLCLELNSLDFQSKHGVKGFVYVTHHIFIHRRIEHNTHNHIVEIPNN